MNALMNMNAFQDWSHNSYQQDDDHQNLYQQQDDDHMLLGSPSAFDVDPFDATANLNVDTIFSPTTASTSVTPKGSIAKPTRRRSRASKKSPTTLLSANPDNFRSLVQKFTGRNSGNSTPGARKGPITLNFAQYNHNNYYNNTTTTFTQQSSNILLQQHDNHKADDHYSTFSISSNYHDTEVPFAAPTTIVPHGEAANSSSEQFNIDKDLDIMLQDLSEPGNYPDLQPAGSSNSTEDFW